MSDKPKILFVCGRNQWRSPTAYNIYKHDTRIEVRSAGVSSQSPHPISNSDIEWADIILIMETEYKARIQGLFRNRRLPPMKSLDIPDEYEYMDNELIELIKSGAEYYINSLLEK